MKKILSILICFASFSSYAANLVIGNGTGGSNNTSQGSLNPGDTIFVVAGTYAGSSTFTNFAGAPGKNIVVMPQSGPNTVVFSGTVNVKNIKYVTFQNFENVGNFFNMRGDGFGGGGLTGLSNVYFHNMHFKNTSGYVYVNYNNIAFNYTTRDTTTLACYKCKWDSTTLDNCGGMIQGGFGTVGDSVDVCMYDTATRQLFNDMQTDGAAFTGIQFRALFDQTTIKQTTVKGYIADNGTFNFGGASGGFSGTISNFYGEGPVSTRISRCDGYALWGSTTDSVLFYNIQSTDKSTFGGIEWESLPTDWLSGRVANCTMAAFNVSLGNCPTLNTYWNYTVDVGGTLALVHIKNCIGWDNVATGKTPGVIIDESGGGVTWDTSHNTYAPHATDLKLDSTTGAPWVTYKPLAGSILIGRGIATPYTSGGQLDLAKHPYANPPVEGPYEFVQSCSNCIIKKRAYRTIFQ
jgi:hypothetical protein